MELEINYPAVDHLISQGHVLLTAVTHEVRSDARRYCPVDTGHLWGTIQMYVAPQRGVVSVGTQYWAAQEYGARPHEIRPKGKGYPLRFFWYRFGKNVAYMKVDHPGNDAQPFMRPAIYKERPTVTFKREHYDIGDLRDRTYPGRRYGDYGTPRPNPNSVRDQLEREL